MTDVRPDAARMAAQKNLNLALLSQQELTALDENQDGMVDTDEVGRLLSRADQNRDGFIDGAELSSMRHLLGAQSPRSTPNREAFVHKVGDQEVVRWDRGADGQFHGTFRGQEFDVPPGQVPALAKDGKLLFLQPGADGELELKGYFGTEKRERVEILPNDQGQVISTKEPGQARVTDVVLRPSIAEAAGRGERVDLSCVPEHLLPKEERQALERYLQALPETSGLVKAAMNKERDGLSIESLSIRDGKLHLQIAERGSPPTQIIASAKEDGSVDAFTFLGNSVFKDGFSADFQTRTRSVPDERKALEGKLEFRTFSRKEKRSDGTWERTYHKPIELVDGTPSTLKLVAESLGGVAEKVFSPFQSAVHYTESAVWTVASKVISDRDLAGLTRVSALYTARQAKLSEWIGKGTQGQEEVMNAYRAAEELLDPGQLKTFHANLDGEIDQQRKQQYGELYDLHRNDPKTDEDRALAAARTFGLKNLSGQYFEMGREAAARGKTGEAALSYIAGGAVIGGQAYLEGFGFGLATKPLKASAAALGTGLRGEQVLAAAARPVNLGVREMQAVARLKWIGRGEMGLFVTPAVIQSGQATGRLLDAQKRGDSRGATAAKEELLAQAAGLGGVMLGLRQAARSGRAALERNPAFRAEPPMPGLGFEGPAPILEAPGRASVRQSVLRISRLAPGELASSADVQILLRQVSASTRSAIAAGTLEGPEVAFEPGVIQGKCGFGQAATAFALEGLGIEASKIHPHQAMVAFPEGRSLSRHSFLVAEMPDGKNYLVDTTFRQFFDPASAGGRLNPGYSGRAMRDLPRGSEIADQILRDGFIELTDSVANAYGQGLSGGASSRVYRAADLVRTSTEGLDYTREEIASMSRRSGE